MNESVEHAVSKVPEVTLPHDHGGLALSRYAASLVLAGGIMVCTLTFKQRAATAAH